MDGSAEEKWLSKAEALLGGMVEGRAYGMETSRVLKGMLRIRKANAGTEDLALREAPEHTAFTGSDNLGLWVYSILVSLEDVELSADVLAKRAAKMKECVL
jgi:hypothetical protein